MAEALNAMQLAWLKAVEKKLGRAIQVESPEDIRILARMNTQTFVSENLADNAEMQNEL